MDFKQSAELRYKNTPVQEFATPMVYAKDTEPKNVDFIIAQGSHDGLNYYVRNVECRHPTAYIEIPQGHKAYNMDFNNWEYNIIDVHGGGRVLPVCRPSLRRPAWRARPQVRRLGLQSRR